MGFGAIRARRQRAMAHSWSTFSIVELHADVRLGDAEGHDQKRIGSNGMPWFVGLGLGHARSARFVAALRIRYYA